MSSEPRPRLFFLVPGDLTSRTGGYGYDRRIIDELTTRQWHVEAKALDGSYPFPTAHARRDTAELLRAIPDGSLVVVDGLAFGAMAEEAELERQRLRLVALVHHPLATETGLAPDDVDRLFASELRAIACARQVVVTSRATVGSLERYGVAPARIAVVEPGTDPRSLAHGSKGAVVHLLCVASVSPRKGHDVLIEALAALPKEGWMLTCVGSLVRDAAWATRMLRMVDAHGLERHVSFVGEYDEHATDAQYEGADIFVLPTLHEGYGMAVAEALAHGLPIISTATGAIGELVGDEAGILVAPANVDALTEALRRMIFDGPRRLAFAAGARRRRASLPTWSKAAERFEAALRAVI